MGLTWSMVLYSDDFLFFLCMLMKRTTRGVPQRRLIMSWLKPDFDFEGWGWGGAQ